MSFKTELHCHMDFSGCSDVSAADMVEKYIAAGYTTVVITNHFNAGYISREGSFDALVRGTFDAIEEVKDAAAGRLHILTGMELTFRCMPNDFLLYGITEEFISNIGEEILDLRPWQMRDRLHQVGGIIIQAHPFRFGQTVLNPDEVDGIEIFNGHSGQRSHNEVAKHWALYWMEHYRRDGSYILTAGSDHHHTWQLPTAGIETEEEITSDEQLLAVLKSGEYGRFVSSLGEMDY